MGDLFCIGHESTVGSDRHVIKEMRHLLGREMAPDKEISPTISTLLLGAQIELSPGFARASIPWPRSFRAIDEINEILKASNRSPAHSEKLGGGHGFAQSLLFGRFGRAILKPLAGRQYSMVRRRVPLQTSLRNALVLWASALMNHKPRLVPLRTIRSCIVYTDACGEGGLVAVLCHPVDVTTHGHAPFGRILIPAGDLRMGAFSRPTRITPCNKINETRTPAILFVDNQSSQDALISGTWKSDLATQICASFWTLEASGGVNVRAGYVPSELNIPDAPSMACSVPRKGNEITNSFGNVPKPDAFLGSVIPAISQCRQR